MKQRKALLQTLTKDQFHALCEVIINAYKGNVLVSDYYVKKLFSFKRNIQMLADKRVPQPQEKDSCNKTRHHTLGAQASAFHAERGTSRHCFRF